MKEILVVDLDETLIKTDLLYENLVLLIKRNPLLIFKVIWLGLTNKAQLKEFVANQIQITPETLPYRQDILTYLKSSDAEIILATASHKNYADAIANYLGIFSNVLASTKDINLKGENKLKEIKKLYNEFSYIGDCSADFPIWKESKRVLCANERIAKKLDKVDHIFEDKNPSFKTYLKTLRVTQWIKNILIFVPLLMAHTALSTEIVLDSVFAFIAFSFIASSVYVINDLMDLESDRKHIYKKFRPLASGSISIPKAGVLCLLSFSIGVVFATLVNLNFILILAGYFFLTTIYSFYLKSVVILDILTLAGLYTIRIIAGGLACNIYLSPWLLLFSMFLFLGLASIKRYAELVRAKKDGKNKVHGRGYIPDDAELVSQMGTTSSYLSVLVLALYLNSDAVVKIYASPLILWMLCPIMLYWLTRLWLLAHRRYLLEDPIVFAVKDKVSILTGVISIILIFMAH